MAAPTIAAGAPAHHKPWYKHLYAQVLCAIVLGVLLGHFFPAIGAQMKPLGDAFIKLIKMLIAPIIFCTVVHGIASMEDMKKVGRVGLKALLYFEVMTTIALIIGLLIVNLWQPGSGMNVDPAALDTKSIASYTQKAGEQSTVEFLLHIIPATVVGAFAEGEILQVLFFAIIRGSTDSDDDVPSTISSSSLMYLRNFQRLKPERWAIVPSTPNTKTRHVA